MDVQQRTRAFDTVEKATELPMLVLSLLLVPILIVPLVVTLPSSWNFAWQSAGWFIWAAFAIELTVKTYLAPRRLTYLRTHWFDVLIVALPFLRPLRLFHTLRALNLLRAAGAVSLGAKSLYIVRELLGRRGMPYAILAGGILIVLSTVAVTFFERGAGGSIDNFGTALWWAVVTAATVGYGDVVPITPAGRGIGVFIMFIGVALFGLFTANVATLMLQTGGGRHAPRDVTLGDISLQLQRLETQVADLRAELVRRDGITATPEPQPATDSTSYAASIPSVQLPTRAAPNPAERSVRR